MEYCILEDCYYFAVRDDLCQKHIDGFENAVLKLLYHVPAPKLTYRTDERDNEDTN